MSMKKSPDLNNHFSSRNAHEPGCRWYVVKCHSGKETLAKLHLERQGFSTFLPFAPGKLSPSRHRSPKGRVPLFPGYLFVQMDLGQQRWRCVNGTIGVSYLVQFGAKPSPMPHGMTEMLIENTNDEGLFSFHEKIQPGDKVRIYGGPMDEFLGELVRLDGKGRGIVLMEFMNRKIDMVVPETSLVRLGSQKKDARQMRK